MPHPLSKSRLHVAAPKVDAAADPAPRAGRNAAAMICQEARPAGRFAEVIRADARPIVQMHPTERLLHEANRARFSQARPEIPILPRAQLRIEPQRARPLIAPEAHE